MLGKDGPRRTAPTPMAAELPSNHTAPALELRLLA